MKVIGRATSMGWKRRKSGDKFRVEIEFDEPPGWPIDVVWSARPIELALVDSTSAVIQNDRNSEAS
jgi:hypothetical protein